MPSINRKQIKEKPVKYKNQNQEFYADKYNSLVWKKLRNTFISLHPICSECLKRNVVKPAEEVHHARKWSSGETEMEQWELFLDERNLRAVCKQCHLGYHKKMDRYNIHTCDDLTDIEYEEAHKLFHE